MTASDDLPENGNGGRATVALVYHAIGEVKELSKAGFSDVQRQLDTLGLDVNELRPELTAVKTLAESNKERIFSVETRVKVLEDADLAAARTTERRKTYRTVHLPSLAIAMCGVLVGLLAVLLNHSF